MLPAGVIILVLAGGLKLFALLFALLVLGFVALTLVAFTPFLQLFLPPEDEDDPESVVPLTPALPEAHPPPRDTAVEHVTP